MTTTLVLLLGLTVGLPCTLLALAIVYHARAAAAPMPAADDGWDFEADAEYASAAFGVPMPDAIAPDVTSDMSEAEPGLAELQHIVAELQQQLVGQRATVASLLSERERAAEAAATPVVASPPAAPELVAATDLGGAVRQLAAEGMSERAIARRLRVGLEEVRLVSRREQAS